jgi:hypothetical protein
MGGSRQRHTYGPAEMTFELRHDALLFQQQAQSVYLVGIEHAFLS